jgi:hypothetical protein
MTPLIYFLALLVSLLGLGIGVILAFLTEEEMVGIRRYLVLAKKLILGGLLGIVGFIYSGSIGMSVLFFVLGFGLGWFILHEEGMIYLILGGIFFVGSLSEKLFPLVCSLILLYGFAAGTLLAQRQIKEMKKDNTLARKALVAGLVYAISAGALYYLKYLPKP